MRRSLAAALAGALLAWGTTAEANPLDAFGFGSRGAAMANAGAADASDFSANYYNPAGLARAPALEYSLGYFRADHFLYLNGQRSAIIRSKGSSGASSRRARSSAFPSPSASGCICPTTGCSRVIALPQSDRRWELYDNRNQRLFFAANVAVSPWDWLQIGGGLSFMAATEGAVDISGNVDVLKPQNSAIRDQVSADLTAIRLTRRRACACRCTRRSRSPSSTAGSSS